MLFVGVWCSLFPIKNIQKHNGLLAELIVIPFPMWRRQGPEDNLESMSIHSSD